MKCPGTLLPHPRQSPKLFHPGPGHGVQGGKMRPKQFDRSRPHARQGFEFTGQPGPGPGPTVASNHKTVRRVPDALEKEHLL